MTMSKFEYADDAALIDEDATTATARVTAIVNGSLNDAIQLQYNTIQWIMNWVHGTAAASS